MIYRIKNTPLILGVPIFLFMVAVFKPTPAQALRLNQPDARKPIVIAKHKVKKKKNKKRRVMRSRFLKVKSGSQTLMYKMKRARTQILLPGEGQYDAVVVQVKGGVEKPLSKTSSISVTIVDQTPPDEPDPIQPPTSPVPTPAPVPFYPDLPEGVTLCDDATFELIESDINELRTQYGLHALEHSEFLEGAAQHHANWMAENTHMTHDGWFDSLQLYLQGQKINSAGQIIAFYILPTLVVQAWSESLGHLQAMIAEKATHMGVGCAVIDDTPYYAVDFAGMVN